MKTRIFTSFLFSLFTVAIVAGDLDGYWYCADHHSNIEVMYTTKSIKVRNPDREPDHWELYNRFENNRYRDNRGNVYYFNGSGLEWNAPGRGIAHHYTRNSSPSGGNWRDPGRNDRGWGDRPGNAGGGWNERDRGGWTNDRDGWNGFYKPYEGKWHNHSTGTHIHVDLSRRSLRIKFHGEKWHEVFERNRGLFVDRKGNEFIFRGEGIEYRAHEGDLIMKFYNDDRCFHRDDYRAEYWR
ncbi:MAG TPA: hypothetical protein PKM27_05660 [Saprospiraceae bacterium]|nr:hypothetical protein [Saprospiraceae bacterium]HNT19948.1 hypothetical protein [Saprospiraceae bacterium]